MLNSFTYYAFKQYSKIKPIMLNIMLSYYAFNIMIMLSKMLLDYSILLTALLEYLYLVAAVCV